MSEDREFTAKIVLSNSLGLAFLLAATTYIDARLFSHVKYGARIYRWGYLVAVMAGVAVFIATWFSFAKASSPKLKAGLSVGILWAVAIVSMSYFRPEFPHGAIVSWTFYLSLASLLSCVIHYWKFRTGWLSSKRLSDAVKIDRVKHYADLWRTISISVTVGYLAILIPWITFLWNIPPTWVTNPTEQNILRQFGCSLVAGLSMYVLFGIVYEAFAKANEAADLLLSISRDQNRR